MLWLALLLPALPLQLAERALPPGLAVAIVEGPPQRLMVVHCNTAARAAGVAPGMKLAAAQALARELIALERNAERERAALAELAGWAYQFSSHIVLQPDGLLLEVGGSARLFGGSAQLHRALVDGLDALSYRSVFACAAAPRMARVAALACTRHAPDHRAEPPQPVAADDLQCLPIACLEWDETTRETLRALGLASIGDLLALPRDAFARRFGTERLADLDRALGTSNDPQPLYEPPAHFHAEIELPADLAETAQLMFPARRLLTSLEGFLRGRNAGATALRFTAAHSARRGVTMPPTTVVLALAAAERDATRLAALLEERLARVQLPAPAITLALAVDQLQPFAALNASLLPQAANSMRGVDWLQLAETLHARLGSERVFQLQAVDDHRPERAWRAVPLAVEEAGTGTLPVPAALRPLLLLPDPQPLPMKNDQPLYHDPLTLVAGPERIECGWWDLGTPSAKAVHRDYFVARNGRGQWLWIFRELAAPRGWFLHGLFA